MHSFQQKCNKITINSTNNDTSGDIYNNDSYANLLCGVLLVYSSLCALSVGGAVYGGLGDEFIRFGEELGADVLVPGGGTLSKDV